MKPQATRIDNRKSAILRWMGGWPAPLSARLNSLSALISRLPRPALHPKHAFWSLGVLASVALTALCVQAFTAPRTGAVAEQALWQPVELPAAIVPEPLSGQAELTAFATPEVQEHIFKVRNGDSLSILFNRAGYGPSIVHQIAYQTEHGAQLSRVYPGQEIRFYLGPDKSLIRIEFPRTDLEYYAVARTEQGFVSSHVIREPEVFPQIRSGTISSSFYMAGQSAGLTDNQIMELAAIFGWDIDFVLEIREGDTFSVVYEERYIDGQQISHGNILAAEFINQGRVHRAIRYEDSKGRVAYYAPDGESMRKAFLRTPLDVFRISSHFNLNRRHPVLNTIRAHKGTDYAAATGTPIKAAGDGRVTFAGVNGGYGNMVRIQHGQNYQTLYAHMSRFASGVRNGAYVQQGQIIGYVGMTGLATGPHLHYEFYLNGNVRNPVTVDLPNGDPIPASELAAFEQRAQPMLALLDNKAREQQYAAYESADTTDI